MSTADNSVTAREGTDGKTEAAGNPWRGPFLKMVAWTAMLGASLLNFLNFNDYPLVRPEVGLLLLSFALIGVALGALEKAAPRFVFVLTGALVGLGADLNLSNNDWALFVALAALVLARFWNPGVVKLATAAFATVFLFQLATGVMRPLSAVPEARAADDPSSPKSAGPPIVHLMLDSYQGLEGMDAEPAFADLRTDTAAFYRQNGFRLYEDAYSRHSNTANSIPYLLSFGTGALATVSQAETRQKLEPLDYFERLSSQGYEISILGANYLDFCTGQPIHDCRQFQYTGLEALTKFDMSTADRAKAIGTALLSMSVVLNRTYERTVFLVWQAGLGDPMALRNRQKTSTPKAALSLIELNKELGHPQRGKVYFAHVLLPHEPYVFDETCRVKPRRLWHTEVDGAERGVRVADYEEQTRCMHRLLDELVDTLQQTPAGREAVVIVQGDHGSRLVNVRTTTDTPQATSHDYAMTYSTLFAIRAPGIEPGLVPGRASLDELLRDFAQSDFTRPPVAGVRPAEVILASGDWIPRRRVPLPKY